MTAEQHNASFPIPSPSPLGRTVCSPSPPSSVRTCSVGLSVRGGQTDPFDLSSVALQDEARFCLSVSNLTLPRYWEEEKEEANAPPKPEKQI